MGKNVVVKFLIALAVACISNDTRCDGALNGQQRNLISFITRPEHWQDMWFEQVKTGTEWIDKRGLPSPSDIFRAIKKLNVIPAMMVCGYGRRFYEFFTTMVHTIDECKSFTQKFIADDCWNKLNRSLEKLVLTTLNLLRVFELIRLFSKSITLGALYGRLLGAQLLIKSKGYNWEIVPVAEYLENVLNAYCRPALAVFHKAQLEDKYTNLNTIIISRYDFYVNTLDSYTDFISKHLRTLGFHYDPHTDITTFTTPDPNE